MLLGIDGSPKLLDNFRNHRLHITAMLGELSNVGSDIFLDCHSHRQQFNNDINKLKNFDNIAISINDIINNPMIVFGDPDVANIS